MIKKMFKKVKNKIDEFNEDIIIREKYCIAGDKLKLMTVFSNQIYESFQGTPYEITNKLDKIKNKYHSLLILQERFEELLGWDKDLRCDN